MRSNSNVHVLFSARNIVFMFPTAWRKTKEAASVGPRIPAAMALRHGLKLPPAAGAPAAPERPADQVRPNPQTGPDTRQATVSIGEKFLAALRSPKAAPPVIASVVKAKAPASSNAAEAASRIAICASFPPMGDSIPRFSGCGVPISRI